MFCPSIARIPQERLCETSTPGIRITPTIRVFHRNRIKAEEISKKIKIKTLLTTETIETDNAESKKEQKQVRIEVESKEEFPLRRVRVCFKLIVPESVELSLRSRYGDMEIDGCGTNISLDNKHGDISVKHVDTAIEINHKNGRPLSFKIVNFSAVLLVILP